MTGYHVTDEHRVPFIKEDGLKPRDTGKWNHPQFGKNEKAVYFFTDKDEADKFLHACRVWSGRRLVMIEVNLDGLELLPDPSFRTLKSSVKTFTHVEASRIS